MSKWINIIVAYYGDQMHSGDTNRQRRPWLKRWSFPVRWSRRTNTFQRLRFQPRRSTTTRRASDELVPVVQSVLHRESSEPSAQFCPGRDTRGAPTIPAAESRLPRLRWTSAVLWTSTRRYLDVQCPSEWVRFNVLPDTSPIGLFGDDFDRLSVKLHLRDGMTDGRTRK